MNFGFRRVSPRARMFTINGDPWIIPGYRSNDKPIHPKADWGNGGEGAHYLAEQILSAIFDVDTPGYGRIRSRVTQSRPFQAAIVNRLLVPESRDEFTITDDEVLVLAPPDIKITAARKRTTWPVIGDKLRFNGTSDFWIVDLKEGAEANLTIGRIYTLSFIECASSWTAVRLDETGDAKYSLHWFDRV